MIEIPLRNGSENAHQRFSIQLGNSFLDFELNYVSYVELPGWSMNIYRDGTPLVLGASLVPNADTIENFRAGIGRLFFVGAEPTIDNLGVANHLVWTPV